MSLDKSSSGDSGDSDPKDMSSYSGMSPADKKALDAKILARYKANKELQAKNRAFRLAQQKKEWEAVRVEGGGRTRRGKKRGGKKAHRKTKSRRAH